MFQIDTIKNKRLWACYYSRQNQALDPEEFAFTLSCDQIYRFQVLKMF